MSNNKGKSWGKCVLESPSLTLFSFSLIISFFFKKQKTRQQNSSYVCRISPGIAISLEVSKQKGQKLKEEQRGRLCSLFLALHWKEEWKGHCGL